MKKSLALIVLCVDYMLRCTYRSSTPIEFKTSVTIVLRPINNKKENKRTQVMLYCTMYSNFVLYCEDNMSLYVSVTDKPVFL
jgi:hypothetical protein